MRAAPDLVDDIDGLVRQLAVVDVARGQFHRRAQRLGGIAHLVMLLEIGFEAAQDLDGVFHRRLVDVDLLEPADQRPILLEMVAEFLVGGRTHAPQVAGRQGRLEDVGRIHGTAAGGAGPDDGVDFVDEHDRAGHVLDFRDHGLEPFLEIASVARAGQQRAHVEGEDDGVVKHLRHLAAMDAPRQTLGDGGLADARVADEQRIVLVAPTQDLNGPFDLHVTADQRVDPPLLGLALEIDAIGFQRLAALARSLLRSRVLLGAMHRALAALARHLGDAV